MALLLVSCLLALCSFLAKLFCNSIFDSCQLQQWSRTIEPYYDWTTYSTRQPSQIIRYLGSLKSLLTCSIGKSIVPISRINNDNTPIPRVLLKNCNCIAFRLDDIQDFFVTSGKSYSSSLANLFQPKLQLLILSRHNSCLLLLESSDRDLVSILRLCPTFRETSLMLKAVDASRWRLPTMAMSMKTSHFILKQNKRTECNKLSHKFQQSWVQVLQLE